MDRTMGSAMWVWSLAVVLGVIYWSGSLARSGIAFESLTELPRWLVVAWKGAFSVSLALAVYLAHHGPASRLIAVALAVSAVADVLLPTAGLVPSGFVFAAAHAIAFTAYWRNRAPDPTLVRKFAAFAVPVLAVLISWLALRDSGKPEAMALFPVISGLVSTAAILSRFPLWLSGLGMTIFVGSDIAALVDLGLFNFDGTMSFITWPCYAIGYALVARGAMLARGCR